MVRHLAISTEKHQVGEVGRHNSWGHKGKKKPSKGNIPMVTANSFSFSELSGPHGGFVTLTKNNGGTFSPPRSRPSTPELRRNRTHAIPRPKTPPGYRPRSIPRARTPTRSRPRTPPRLRHVECPRPSPIRKREHSPHIRGARSNSQKDSEQGRSPSPVFSFSSMSPNPSDDGRFIPAPFVYDEEIRDPPPQTETVRDTKKKIAESLPWKDPTVAQMSPRRIIDDDSIEAESGIYAVRETTKTPTKMSSKNQSVANSNHPVKQSGLPSPSSMAQRNNNTPRSRTTSPQRLFKKRSKSPLRNIRLSLPKSHGDSAKQSKQATEMDPACAPSCADPSRMASPQTLELKADQSRLASPETLEVNTVKDAIVEDDSGENENSNNAKLDNDYGFGKVISGALAYWARLEPNEDAEGGKDKSCTEGVPEQPNPEAPVTTALALEPGVVANQGEAGDGMHSEHSESDDIVFHVRLNVESFIGVSATHRHFRRSKNDHSLMQGYVEVVNPSIVAENSPPIVASQPDISTAVGTSKHHCFLWSDNIKDKSRNRLYLTLPVYQKQEGSITKYATPDTVHLRIGVKRGDDLIPLGDAFLVIDIDCPNMHERTFELTIHPSKKESKNRIRGLFSKRKVSDTSYKLDEIAVLRCIVQAQPGLESISGATFWGDKPQKRNDIEQGVIHELCSHDSETNPQSQQTSKPWNNRVTSESELFLSPTGDTFEGQPLNAFAASSFVKNTLSEGSTERGRDRVEQLRSLPSPVAQGFGAPERNLDKVERLRSPTSTGAHQSETETSRDDVEQTRASHREDKFFGYDRDHAENQETDSDAVSVTDPGCTTFWTLGSTRITAKVGTLIRKNDLELATLQPFIENRSSQSFRRDLYQIPDNSALIDQSKNLSMKLCQPLCKIPHNMSPVEDVKVTYEEIEDRTWQARMRSIVQDEHHDLTDDIDDGSAVLEVEEPQSKLQSARNRKNVRPLPTVEEDKFNAVSTDDQFASSEHQIATEAKPHTYLQAKQQEGPEVKFAIDDNQISNVKSDLKKDPKESWVDTQDIAADSFAISENDSLTAESVGDTMSPKPSHHRQGLKPDPPSCKAESAYRNQAQLKLTKAQKAADCVDSNQAQLKLAKAQKAADCADITLETPETETNDETDGTEAFSWITDTTKAADPNASMLSGTSINVDADSPMPDRCITPTHLTVTDLTVPKEQECIIHQPSTKIPAKLPTTRNIQQQLSEDFTEWADAGPGVTSRHMPFFNCACDDDVDYTSDPEKDEPQDVDSSVPILQNFHSFATTEGFETVLDLKRELDQRYSLLASLSNLSRDLFWPTAKIEEAKIRDHPYPEIAPSSSSSSSGSQNLSNEVCWSPTRKDRFSSETRQKAIGSRQPAPLTQKQVSDISSIIESMPSPLSADSYCSDSKYDEAARKIFRVAKKLGISADSLIDQLEKGEKIERLLSRKIQGRQQQKHKSKRPVRKHRKNTRSGYV